MPPLAKNRLEELADRLAERIVQERDRLVELLQLDKTLPYGYTKLTDRQLLMLDSQRNPAWDAYIQSLDPISQMEYAEDVAAALRRMGNAS